MTFSISNILIYAQTDMLEKNHKHGERSYLTFKIFLAKLHSLWDLSSPSRDWTSALNSESRES